MSRARKMQDKNRKAQVRGFGCSMLSCGRNKQAWLCWQARYRQRQRERMESLGMRSSDKAVLQAVK